MSEPPPKRDRLLAAFSLPVAGGLTVVGLVLVLAAPSFAVNVAGAAVLGLAGTVAMIDVFIRIGLAEDRERAREAPGEGEDHEHADPARPGRPERAPTGARAPEDAHGSRGGARHDGGREPARDEPDRDRGPRIPPRARPAARRLPREDWKPRRRP